LPVGRSGKAREREQREDEEFFLLDGKQSVTPSVQEEAHCPSRERYAGGTGGNGDGDITFLWRLPLRFLSRLVRNLLIPLMTP